MLPVWDDDLSFGDSDRFDEDSLSSLDSRSSTHAYDNFGNRDLQVVTGANALFYQGGTVDSEQDESSDDATLAEDGALNSSNPVRSGSRNQPSFIRRLTRMNNLRKRVTTRLDCVPSLTDLAAKRVASEWSFEAIELTCAQVMASGCISMTMEEGMLTKIERYSFPTSLDDVRLYSCLLFGNASEYRRGAELYERRRVRKIQQIGFHLLAEVTDNWGEFSMPEVNMRTPLGAHHSAREERICQVSITVDRCAITSCHCNGCEPLPARNPNLEPVVWCSHVVAVCLHRINEPDKVEYRAPISIGLDDLGGAKSSAVDVPQLTRQNNQLKKFALNLLNTLPREYMAKAQHIMDQLKDPLSALSLISGIPDPTAGGNIDDIAHWCIDEAAIVANTNKILAKFASPSAATIYGDITCLETTNPKISQEFSCLQRPFRTCEPEALWNLLKIVNEMLRRNDNNATKLLHLVTERCLAFKQIIVWWYSVSATRSARYPLNHAQMMRNTQKSGMLTNTRNAQHMAAVLCDAVVDSWRRLALNPRLARQERLAIGEHLVNYHQTVLEFIWGMTTRTEVAAPTQAPSIEYYNQMKEKFVQQNFTLNIMGYGKLTERTLRLDIDVFPGFATAIRACRLHWPNMPGITAGDIKSTARLELMVEALKRARINHPPSLEPQPVPRGAVIVGAHSRAQQRDQDSEESGQGSRSPSESKEINSEHVEDGDESDDATPSEVEEIDPRSQKMIIMVDRFLQISEDSEPPVAIEQIEASTSEQPVDPVPAIVQYLQEMQFDDSNFIETQYSYAVGMDAHGFTEQCQAICVKMASEYILHPPVFDITLPDSVLPDADLIRGYTCTQQPAPVVPLISKNIKLKKMRPRAEIGTPSTSQLLVPHRNAVAHSRYVHRTLTIVLFIIRVLKHSRKPEHRQLIFELTITVLRLRRPAATDNLTELHNYVLDDQIEQVLKKLYQAASCPRLKNLLMEECDQLGKAMSSSEETNSNQTYPLKLMTIIFQLLVDSCRQANNQTDTVFNAALKLLEASSWSTYSKHASMLLAERMRRERKDLISLLIAYASDDAHKLSLILYHFFDNRLHRLFPTHDYCLDCFINVFNGSYASHYKAIHQQRHAKSTEKDGVKLISPRAVHDQPSTSRQSADSSKSSASTRSSDLLKVDSTNHLPWRPMAQSLHAAIEACADNMLELSKTVFKAAGVIERDTIFLQPPAQNVQTVQHRALQLVGTLMCMYSLGLTNKITPTWTARTYSNVVSTCLNQVQELGRPAFRLLVHIWQRHFTPSEMATMINTAAQRAECAPKSGYETALLELALTVLESAHALSHSDTRQLLNTLMARQPAKCEEACDIVEKVARTYGVYYDVAFDTARKWHEMYLDMVESQGLHTSYQPSMASSASHVSVRQVMPIMPPLLSVPPPNLAPPDSYLHYYYQQQMALHHPPQVQYRPVLPMSASAPALNQHIQPVALSNSHHNDRSSQLLHNAYRVGMLALDLLRKRMEEERGYVNQYSLVPIYTKDVDWLFAITKTLYDRCYYPNPEPLYQLFNAFAKSINSPFLLHRFGVNAATFESCSTQLPRSIVQPPNLMSMIDHPPNHYKPLKATELLNCVRSIVNRADSHQCYFPAEYLYAKALIAIYAASACKLSHFKFQLSDQEEVVGLVKEAKSLIVDMEKYFRWPPHCANNITRDLDMFMSRQKAYKKSATAIKEAFAERVNL